MAKAKKGKAKKATQRDHATGHKPNSADLKYIGAAFDRTIESLQEIRSHAKNPAEVDAKIDRLNELKAELRQECPQSWYVPFEIE